jgi:myosin protein heavy chain
VLQLFCVAISYTDGILHRILLWNKAEQLENEARQAKEQLSELTRTAADYSKIIEKKEGQIVALEQHLNALKVEHDHISDEIMALRADVDTLDGQLAAEREDRATDVAARDKVVAERDDLRILLATKASEETRRSEVERSKELELAELRRETAKLHQELGDLKRTALESQNKSKLELEQITRDHFSLQSSHTSLLDRERSAQSQLTKVKGQVTELERARRTLESELLSSRSRLHEHEAQLTEVSRQKEVIYCIFLPTLPSLI